MAALEQFSPTAQAVIKVFAYPFRSAPTADLVSWGVATLQAGTPPGAWLNTLLALPVPQSPFTAYAPGTSNTAFCTALVDHLSFAIAALDDASAVKAAWVTALVPMLAAAPSRGDFVVQVALLIEGYTGSDASLLALKAGLAERAEKAAVFALSPQGAVYDGQGFAQLLAPLTPVSPPTYELSASASAVDEGQALVFELRTTHVAPGTVLPFTLTGVSADDVLGGALTGSFTIDSSGRASLTVNLAADARTEGDETVTLQLDGVLAQVSATVRDTSVTPPPVPVYALLAAAASVDEGAGLLITLATSHVAMGTLVPYTLSGAGITTADLVGGALTGSFSVGADGRASFTLPVAADLATEGAEVLRLQLDGRDTRIEITLNDTSLTPSAPATKDTVLVPDVLGNSRQQVPPTPADGEIRVDSWLTYDLLDQSGSMPRRMDLAALQASGSVAGAPLVTSNRSADRGNIPQVSNQSLMTYSLGLELDRVDYSTESGRVAALLTRQLPAGTQYLLVNDDATNDVYNNATDRIDTLVDVEEVVASAGGGLLDLTASQRDWLLTFSRGWDITPEIAATRDREIHRLLLSDPSTGNVHPVTYLEFRDAGLDPLITQAPVLWSQVQGSDRNETLVFSTSESVDARTHTLRGGENVLKYNNLTRSILVDLAATPWTDSASAADDSNPSGVLGVTVKFTNGDGTTLLSANSHVTTWHGSDHKVSTGSLLLNGTQDAEDALSFDTITQPKVLAVGQSVNGVDQVMVRLANSPAAYPLALTGFERINDNGASDDLVLVGSIVAATSGSPRLRDAMADDHDAVALNDSSLGTAAVGGVAGSVSLTALNSAGAGFDFDFDVLDLSRLTQRVSVSGTPGTDDELVAGPLLGLASVTGFESLVLSTASLDQGGSFTLNLDAGTLTAGSASVAFGGNTISAGGPALGVTGRAHAFSPLPSAVAVSVVDTTPGAGAVVWGGQGSDTLTGGGGDDVLRGGAGDDTLSGGTLAETWTFTLAGTADTNPAQRVAVTLTIDGTVLTLTEAATEDSNHADRNGAVVDGSGAAAFGFALASLVNTNLATINAGPGNGVLSTATFNAGTGVLTLRFVTGVNATDAVSAALVLNADAGSLSLGSGSNLDGGTGGADRFVFEATGAANGSDTLRDFYPANDRLDLTAFTGTAMTSAGTPIDASTGAVLPNLASQVQRVFNKTGGLLAAADFSTLAVAGKLVLPDGARSVIVVTADPTGARGDAADTPMNIYMVSNGATAGLSDLSVSLVGSVSSSSELTLADMAGAFS